MGSANCKGMCQPETSPFSQNPLILKQFSAEETQTFVNSLQPYFYEYEQESDVANLRDVTDKGMQSLNIDEKLKDLLEQFKIDMKQNFTNAKLWKLNRNLQQLSHQYGPAYIWSQQIKKSEPQKSEKKQNQKQSLLNQQIQILIAQKNNPTHIAVYFTGKLRKGYAQDQKALYIEKNGTIYSGKVVNSSACGFGKFENRTYGYCYEGTWFQDYPHSPIQQATQTLNIDKQKGEQSKQKYVGQFKYGKRQGNGKLISPASSNHPRFQYIGQFKDSKFHGQGKLETFFDNNQTLEIYEGEFKMGQKHGNGQWKGYDQKYKGEWLDGKKSGKGQYVFSKSNTKYIGGFKNDNFNGQGEIQTKDDQKIKGLWVNGRCVLKI